MKYVYDEIKEKIQCQEHYDMFANIAKYFFVLFYFDLP